MIAYRELTMDDVVRLADIDRSESIDYIYEMKDGDLLERPAFHECPTWDTEVLREIEERFTYEILNGGTGVGAFDGEMLVGFGVLAHQFRGVNQDQLQVDLMYVSRNYRRRGIGKEVLNRLSVVAKSRGAKQLYISSTETRSAVFFYKSMGSKITNEVDVELFQKEPYDIHMIKEL